MTNLEFTRSDEKATAILRAVRQIDDGAELAPVVHGRWERTEHCGFLRCSECKDVYISDEWVQDGKWSYCPNCGAKMDGGIDHG